MGKVPYSDTAKTNLRQPGSAIESNSKSKSQPSPQPRSVPFSTPRMCTNLLEGSAFALSGTYCEDSAQFMPAEEREHDRCCPERPTTNFVLSVQVSTISVEACRCHKLTSDPHSTAMQAVLCVVHEFSGDCGAKLCCSY
jgi:hypothetical protein